MFKVEWKVDGKKVRPDQLGAEMMKVIESGVAKQTQKAMEGKLAHLRCEVHGERPRILSPRLAHEKLQFSLHTCCDEMTERAKAVLGTTK